MSNMPQKLGRKFHSVFSFAAVGLVVLAFHSPVNAASLSATDIMGLRGPPFVTTGVILLTFQSVKATEDRVIAHYDISGFSVAPVAASLFIPVRNFDPSGADGTFDVYSFTGDGIVSTDEWNSGVLFQSFSGLGQPGALTVDITSLMASAIGVGDSFLSFNFRVGSGLDRWFLGSPVGLGDSVIDYQMSAIPLPASLPLFLSGLVGLGVIGRRKKKVALQAG